MPQKRKQSWFYISKSLAFILAIALLINGLLYLYPRLIKKAANISNSAEILPSKPEKWMTYRNDQYNYTIDYPEKWDVIEAKKVPDPSTNKTEYFLLNEELQKVTFFYVGALPENTSDIGQFQLSVHPNREKYSLDQWIDNLKKTQQNTLILVRGNTEVHGITAKNLSISHFAENYTALVFSKGENIYLMKFGINNTNGGNNNEAGLIYNEIYNQMANTFN